MNSTSYPSGGFHFLEDDTELLGKIAQVSEISLTFEAATYGEAGSPEVTCGTDMQQRRRACLAEIIRARNCHANYGGTFYN